MDAHKGLTPAVVKVHRLTVAPIVNRHFGQLCDYTPGKSGRCRSYVVGDTMLNIIGPALMGFMPLLVTADGSGPATAAEPATAACRRSSFR